MAALALEDRFMNLVKVGEKTSTVRRGVRPFTPGEVLTLEGTGGDNLGVFITEVTFKMVEDLTDADARADGFEDSDELLEVLEGIYGALTPSETVTVIRFAL